MEPGGLVRRSLTTPTRSPIYESIAVNGIARHTVEANNGDLQADWSGRRPPRP